MTTRPTCEFPEWPVLHGPLLTGLSDDEFFELCQTNPALSFERNAQHEIIIIPPPVLNLVSQASKPKASGGCGTTKPA